jgi:hypothetical protein
MTRTVVDHMRKLMEQSLPAWGLTGGVQVTPDAAILMTCGTHEIRIEPASSDVPFRWTVTIDNRRRGAISVVAVLRQVRSAVDPGYAGSRALIAASPLVPPL